MVIDMSHPLSRPPAGTENDYDDLAAAFDRRFKRMGSANFNGSSKFINMLLSVLTLLVSAAICGEVVVYGQVQGIEARVQGIQSTVNVLATHEYERR